MLLAEELGLGERRGGALLLVPSSTSSGIDRGTRMTNSASTAASRSLARAIAVAAISSPMSPSFMGTSRLRNSAPGGAASGSMSSSSPISARSRVRR